MKVGDSVYWKINIRYVGSKTISGVIESIDENEICTIVQNTQKTYGKRIKKARQFIDKTQSSMITDRTCSI